jgi:hypothetical protein
MGLPDNDKVKTLVQDAAEGDVNRVGVHHRDATFAYASRDPALDNDIHGVEVVLDRLVAFTGRNRCRKLADRARGIHCRVHILHHKVTSLTLSRDMG